jgi:hypothetical protein
LLKVLFLQVGIVLEQIPSIRVAGEDVEHVLHRNAHAANAWLSAHLARFDCDSIKRA